ncbi:MAG: hypothetical protein PQJ50_00235, partial [Spirochaetales bacterium]|nr:hypothetical protein [Spirochaetales bacterium]
MKKTLFFGLLLFTIGYGIMAQDGQAEGPERQNQMNLEQLLKDALTIHIQARLFHDVQNVVWQSDVEKLTIPGRSVTINMQNEQAKLSMHFTPYRKTQGGLILV